ncbi:MAG: hypothetical protein ABL983_18495, partial [Nitrospira sp.]
MPARQGQLQQEEFFERQTPVRRRLPSFQKLKIRAGLGEMDIVQRIMDRDQPLPRSKEHGQMVYDLTP